MKKKNTPVPFHNEPNQVFYWFVWVILAAIACFVVSFSLFYKSNNVPEKQISIPSDDTLNVSKAQNIPVKDDFLENIEESQQSMHNTLNTLQNVMIDVQSQTALSEGQMLSLTSLVMHLQNRIDTLQKPISQTEQTIATKNDFSWRLLLSKKITHNLTVFDLKTASQYAQNEKIKVLFESLAEIKETQENVTLSKTLSHFYEVFLKGAPQKENMLASYTEKESWKDYVLSALSRVVYVTKDNHYTGALTWKKAMMQVDRYLEKNALEEALVVLNKAPLLGDKRLNQTRQFLSYIVAENALWYDLLQEMRGL